MCTIPTATSWARSHTSTVDKRTGQVEYAVLEFGGMLGIGSDYYPLPWDVLNYDEDKGGYVVELDKEALKNAPHFAANEDPIYTSDYGTGRSTPLTGSKYPTLD